MSFQQNRRIHLDSSVYIAFLNGETIQAYGGLDRVDLAELIFDAGEAGLIDISTSMVTLVEVRRGANSSPTPGQFRVDLIDELFDRSSTRFVDVDHAVALTARRIANHYGIYAMDAIQVASAEAVGCDELFIWDNRVVSKFSANPQDDCKVAVAACHSDPEPAEGEESCSWRRTLRSAQGDNLPNFAIVLVPQTGPFQNPPLGNCLNQDLQD